MRALIRNIRFALRVLWFSPAFTAVVAGQMANAFACRSASLWPGRLGWMSNRYLVLAVICEAAMLASFLYIPPVAALLGHAPPNAIGYAIAAAAIPAVLVVDGLYKRERASRTMWPAASTE